MKTVLKAKIVELYFNISITENHALLGKFTSKKRAIKHMKKLTKKYNYRDRYDAWNTPLKNFKDYLMHGGIVSVKEYKKLRKEGY